MSHVKWCFLCGILDGIAVPITAIGSVILQAAVNGLRGYSNAVTAGSRMLVVSVWLQPMPRSDYGTYRGQKCSAGKLDRVKEGVSCQ